MRVPATVEHPLTSRLWLAPPLLRFLNAKRTVAVTTHFCQWGERWMKPTRFAGCFVDLAPINKTCHMHGKLCSRTHQEHNVLAGQAPSGAFWTHIAEPYPWKL